MPVEILMPALSPTMTEGNLARWLKQEGETVSPGDVLAEIETDKATMEIEAIDEGTLGRIVVPDGTEGVCADRRRARVCPSGREREQLEVLLNQKRSRLSVERCGVGIGSGSDRIVLSRASCSSCALRVAAPRRHWARSACVIKGVWPLHRPRGERSVCVEATCRRHQFLAVLRRRGARSVGCAAALCCHGRWMPSTLHAKYFYSATSKTKKTRLAKREYTHYNLQMQRSC